MARCLRRNASRPTRATSRMVAACSCARMLPHAGLTFPRWSGSCSSIRPRTRVFSCTGSAARRELAGAGAPCSFSFPRRLRTSTSSSRARSPWACFRRQKSSTRAPALPMCLSAPRSLSCRTVTFWSVGLVPSSLLFAPTRSTSATSSSACKISTCSGLLPRLCSCACRASRSCGKRMASRASWRWPQTRSRPFPTWTSTAKSSARPARRRSRRRIVKKRSARQRRSARKRLPLQSRPSAGKSRATRPL
mmetsp:Transcript_9739/g.27534  ORF Transcript_9739/g.27534 Transcript_9739/m.27534 type:complete len:249 (-) Transcript_9739:184-930(-)